MVIYANTAREPFAPKKLTAKLLSTRKDSSSLKALQSASVMSVDYGITAQRYSTQFMILQPVQSLSTASKRFQCRVSNDA